MKKILVLLVLVAAATTVFVGCSLLGAETYAYDASTTSGFCVEITTNDLQVKDAAEAAGYELGTCPTKDQLGTCADYVTIEGESFSALFYSTSGLTAAGAETACSQLNGTWKAK